MKTDFLRGFVIGLVLSCVLAIGLYLVFGPEVPVPVDPMDVDLVEVDRVEGIYTDGIFQEVDLYTGPSIFDYYDCPTHGRVSQFATVTLYPGESDPHTYCSYCVADLVLEWLNERGLKELEVVSCDER